MSDVVVTVPKRRWREWLAEGDCAGEPPARPGDGAGGNLHIAADGDIGGILGGIP